jgi:hypothetical protein
MTKVNKLKTALIKYTTDSDKEKNLKIILDSRNMEYLWKLARFVAEPVYFKKDLCLKDFAEVDWDLLNTIQDKMIEVLEYPSKDDVDLFSCFVNSIPGTDKKKFQAIVKKINIDY